jgi:hypothetical protein
MADGVEKEGEGLATTEAARPPPQGRGQRPGWRCSFEEKKGRAPRCCSGPAAPQAPAPSEEKAGSADTESATTVSTDNSPSSKAEDVPAKEEPKQSDVPAAVAAAAVTTPAAEDAAAKATAQPPETAESSQAEEKTGERPARARAGAAGPGGPHSRPLGHQGRGRCTREFSGSQEKLCFNSKLSPSLRENSESAV